MYSGGDTSDGMGILIGKWAITTAAHSDGFLTLRLSLGELRDTIRPDASGAGVLNLLQ